MKIAIDIGHTASTSAVSAYGVEHSLAKPIAHLLLSLLQAEGQHEIQIIDYPEMASNAAELKQVVADANSWGADLVISLHADYASHEEARGAHVCYYSSKGAALASCIASELCPIMQGRADSTKQRTDLYILRCTSGLAVLIELGFITNPDDVAMLANKQNVLAQAIYRGIKHYMN